MKKKKKNEKKNPSEFWILISDFIPCGASTLFSNKLLESVLIALLQHLEMLHLHVSSRWAWAAQSGASHTLPKQASQVVGFLDAI